MRVIGYARRNWPETALLVVVMLVICLQLFGHPLVGLADSGDFSRLTDWFGIHGKVGDGVSDYRHFVIPKWDWDRSFAVHYPSSEVLIMGAAGVADLVLFRDGRFDIRAQGLANFLAFLAVFLLLAWYARGWSVGRRLLLYGLVAFMFTDVGYIAFFNSFFSEPASLIFFGAVVLTGLIAIRDGEESNRKRLFITAFFLAAALFVTAKVQNAALGLPLAFVGYRLHGVVKSTGPKPVVSTKRLAVVLAVSLVVLSGVYFQAYSRFSRGIKAANIYNSVFGEILPNAHDPAGTAMSLGLDERFYGLIGSTMSTPGVTKEMTAEVRVRVSYWRILRYYVTHPGHVIDLAGRASHKAFSMRPPYLGNFESDYVLAGRKFDLRPGVAMTDDYFSHRFALWSKVKDAVLPKSLGFIIGFVLANVAAIVVKLKRFDRTRRDRMASEFHAVLVLMMVMEFLTVIIGEGEYEIVKHLFLFNTMFEVCLVFLFAYLVSGIGVIRRKEPAADMEIVA